MANGEKNNYYDISVIVPVYNAEKYISECIESILNQTKNNIEIVIVNDGCTDSTPSIIEQYEKNNSNIKIVTQDNGGLAAARISGLKNVSGKYIGWVDADDFIKPEMYEVLYNVAVENGADYVYCDYEFYPEKIATKEKWFKEFTGKRDWNYIDRNTQCWNTLTLKELIDEVKLTEKYKQYEEYSWIAVMLAAKKVISIKQELYCYRVGNITMSGGSYKGKLEHFKHGVELTSNLKGILKGSGYEKSLSEYMEYRYIYTLIQLQIVAAINKSYSTYRTAEEELKRIRFKKNKYTKLILNENHGVLKSFVMRNLIPASYLIARIITKIVF